MLLSIYLLFVWSSIPISIDPKVMQISSPDPGVVHCILFCIDNLIRLRYSSENLNQTLIIH